MSRPDDVWCCLTGRYNSGEGKGPAQRDMRTWCGREPGDDGFFLDASHAVIHADNGGYHRLCPECAAAIKAAIDKGTYVESLSRPGA